MTKPRYFLASELRKQELLQEIAELEVEREELLERGQLSKLAKIDKRIGELQTSLRQV